MKNWKKVIALFLVMFIVAGCVPFQTFAMTESMVSKTATAKKLSKKDFVFKIGNTSTDFIEKSKSHDWGWFYYFFLEKRNNVKTARGIKLGSTMSSVTNKYGKTTLKKFSGSDKFYKRSYYEPNLDTTTWKSYMKYTYTQDGHDYGILFCFDKNKKTIAILYFSYLKQFLGYDKIMNVKLQFEAPKGKKITTKTIAGKKVKIIPKGTKMYRKSPSDYNCGDFWIEQYGENGGEKATTELESMKVGEKYDVEKFIKEKCYTLPDWKKLERFGSYRYFAITFQVFSDSDTNKVVPDVYYIKFK